jgi:hypothetical protein
VEYLGLPYRCALDAGIAETLPSAVTTDARLGIRDIA